MNSLTCDILIIGGGPAGIAAAARASQSHQQVIIVDDNPALGGQIWRGAHRSPQITAWMDQVRDVQVINARVFRAESSCIQAESPDAIYEFRYKKLILATGARERFLPFPGWTLPNVVGAGGLQALVKGGLPVRGKWVVVAGSGPLLLAVAAYLRDKGAEIVLIAEQTSREKLARFSTALAPQPAKITQMMGLQWQLLGIPYLTSCWPISAEANGDQARITLQQPTQNGDRRWQVECDYLACGFYLVPNLELPTMLGCAIKDGYVQVNNTQETNLPNVYCAGEITGIGGVERSLVEGQIAGYAAAGQADLARRLFAERTRHRRFGEQLSRAFALNDNLKALSTPDTLICRCEDVSRERLDAQDSWRTAKLQTRCGMGPCQGRVCGPIVSFLYGWQPESVRPPLFPVRLEALAASSGRESEKDKQS